ncbi:hypothetical protein DERF_006193 [Dermatophagoides farinae]|uniref:Uncharacterized protein n=1 Tax=Dermatophagoides farinae TaxID=6954 RepID=A0A922L9G4_DERFA|nr:hypothetical protein DERF_006193 [Dermatophagoides farinae]
MALVNVGVDVPDDLSNEFDGDMFDELDDLWISGCGCCMEDFLRIFVRAVMTGATVFAISTSSPLVLVFTVSLKPSGIDTNCIDSGG